jgi:hypothetical protein
MGLATAALTNVRKRFSIAVADATLLLFDDDPVDDPEDEDDSFNNAAADRPALLIADIVLVLRGSTPIYVLLTAALPIEWVRGPPAPRANITSSNSSMVVELEEFELSKSKSIAFKFEAPTPAPAPIPAPTSAPVTAPALANVVVG